MKLSAVAFDFDETLAYFAGATRVPDILVKNGVEVEIAQRAYVEVCTLGFSPWKMVNYLRQIKAKVNEDVFLSDFQMWLEKHLKLYEDARSVICWLESRGVPWAIVTFGDGVFQRYKINLLGLKPVVVYSTPKIGQKALPLLELNKKYGELLFVDDTLREIQGVCLEDLKLTQPCLINRQGESITSGVQQITSLEEIKMFFE